MFQNRYLLISLLLIVALTFISIGLFQPQGENYSRQITITVKENDTLWDIASEVNDGRYNVHQIVSRIKDYNEIDSVIIQPGQELIVPIVDEDLYYNLNEVMSGTVKEDE